MCSESTVASARSVPVCARNYVKELNKEEEEEKKKTSIKYCI